MFQSVDFLSIQADMKLKAKEKKPIDLSENALNERIGKLFTNYSTLLFLMNIQAHYEIMNLQNAFFSLLDFNVF